MIRLPPELLPVLGPLELGRENNNNNNLFKSLKRKDAFIMKFRWCMLKFKSGTKWGTQSSQITSESLEAAC